MPKNNLAGLFQKSQQKSWIVAGFSFYEVSQKFLSLGALSLVQSKQGFSSTMCMKLAIKGLRLSITSDIVFLLPGIYSEGKNQIFAQRFMNKCACCSIGCRQNIKQVCFGISSCLILFNPPHMPNHLSLY